jgi:hypothetical protein
MFNAMRTPLRLLATTLAVGMLMIPAWGQTGFVQEYTDGSQGVVASMNMPGPMQLFRLEPLPVSTPPTPRPHTDGLPDGLLVVDGEVSKPFIQEIERDVRKLPQQALTALAKAGYKIQLARTVTDAVPAARNQQVRGYEPHSTWNSVYGMFNRTTRKVVMAEFAEHGENGGGGDFTRLEDRQRRQGILRHEFGHAVDNYLGNFSHTAKFRNAYEKELAAIGKGDREWLYYYLQPGDAGPEETFAELFASLDQTACDKRSDDMLHHYFPELTRLIRSQLATMK